jgi:CxxC-x17-CxxC domain-containing protein
MIPNAVYHAGREGNHRVLVKAYKSNLPMFPATCSQCGQDTEMPFEPREDRPVYCRDCYKTINWPHKDFLTSQTYIGWGYLAYVWFLVKIQSAVYEAPSRINAGMSCINSLASDNTSHQKVNLVRIL